MVHSRMSKEERGKRYLMLLEECKIDHEFELDILRQEMLGCEEGEGVGSVFRMLNPIKVLNSIVAEGRASRAEKTRRPPNEMQAIEGEIHELDVFGLPKTRGKERYNP